MSRRCLTPDARAGFTMVEVLVALVILTVGVLGLAGTTALVVRQVTLADMTTERAAALQDVVERLKAADYGNVGTGTATMGHFTAEWTTTELRASKLVEIVTVGPGLVGGDGGLPHLGSNVADTFVYRIIQR